MNNNNVLASDCIIFKDSSADDVCGVGWVEKWVKWNKRFHDYCHLNLSKQSNITVISNCCMCLCYKINKNKKQGKAVLTVFTGLQLLHYLKKLHH